MLPNTRGVSARECCFDTKCQYRIGELLLKEKRISAEQLQEALNYQRTSGGKLGANLVKLGFVKDEEITALLSKQYGVPSIALNQFEIDPAVIKLVPAETARKYQIVPLSRAGATLTIAMTDPTNVFAMDDVKFMTGYNVEPVVASETAVLDSIDKYYGAPAVAGASAAGRGGNQANQVVQSDTGESALDAATRSLTEMPTMLADTARTSRSSRISKRSAPRCCPARARKRRSSSW